jgi:activator of HSP90 ATPase
MQTSTIKQKIKFNATPAKIYKMLMDPKTVAEFTGGKCKISQKVKGKFEIFDSYCHGYNIVLDPGKLIIQAWYFKEDGWPENHFSSCTFELKKIEGGCQLEFIQEKVPAHKVEDLKKGWKTYYWNPMKKQIRK